MTELIKVNFRNITGVKVVAQRLNRQTVDAIFKHVNEQSRDWLKAQAVKNLDQSIKRHGRPQRFNRIGTRDTPAVKSLRETIGLNSSHLVTAHSIDFMVDDLVRPNAPHYHVIEEGYGGFVDKEAPIGFRSGGRFAKAGEGRYPQDATLRGGGKITIKRAIQGYHYTANAVDQFLDEEIFESYLDAAAERLRRQIPGLVIEIKRGPKSRSRLRS